ncbi:pyridoxal phosphate-dependent transferase [Entophlyctis helioformis]|nr:pyridoxal phosphate-dependent transferase [Entophlyctis helioformis]
MAAQIKSLAQSSALKADSLEFARLLDAQSTTFRSDFCVPKVATVSTHPHELSPEQAASESIYLCGNSLGLQPAATRTLINQELDVWSERGVHGHFEHRFGRPWVSIDDHVIEQSAKIVGAHADEVAIMNSLTANLHFLMVPFYRPTPTRFKILLEAKSFPSDYYALESQARFHGYDPAEALIQLSPRAGDFTLRTEDILETISKHGDQIALVMFSGVQYYTGQWFEMEKITTAAKAKGCIVGFDLAHAVGNVPMSLHDWDVDFACWCSYKYLNSGPGGIGGAFVHNKHAKDNTLKRFAGWWGSDPESKFLMDNTFVPIAGANSYRLSNPCVLAVVAMAASLQVFGKTDMQTLRQKSLLLTGFLELLLDEVRGDKFQIITPRDPAQRGCQLSLLFTSAETTQRVFAELSRQGVVCDERKPDVIRIAPAPLYNTFEDVHHFVRIVSAAL